MPAALVPYALTIPAIQALTDGQFFLEHLDLLRTVAIEPFCRRCALAGVSGLVTVLETPDRFTFRCAHASGWIKRTEPLEVQPLLTALGWDLRCPHCGQLVDANNERTDATFLVTCPCAVRAMANPLAARHAPASRVAAMDGVGRAESL